MEVWNLTDIETQIKALRLSWIPRISDERRGTWKSYFNFLLVKENETMVVPSYEYFKHKGLHSNFLNWTALRTSVPKSLKARVLVDESDPVVLQDAHKDFDIKSVKSRHFYKLLLSKKLSYQICQID